MNPYSFLNSSKISAGEVIPDITTLLLNNYIVHGVFAQ